MDESSHLSPFGETLTWLHLSDLHAGERTDWDAGRVLKTLLDDLRILRDEHELRPDLIFFTGDAAFAGLPDEFDTAGHFLEEVREACGLERENVFLVPGNHDVDRSVVDPGDTEWLDEQRKAHDAIGVNEMLRQGDADECWRRIMSRLAEYRDFLERAGYDHLLADPERLTYACRRRVRGLDVAVAGLNSAWSCHGDDRGRLWLGGHYQLATLEPELVGARIRIVLGHHPEAWFGEGEAGFEYEVQRLFDFHLHGHEHESWVTAHADSYVRVAAGACYDRSDRENGYNLVRLDFENDKGEVSLRRYERTAGAWHGRAIPGKTDAHGVWHVDIELRFESLEFVNFPALSCEVLVDEVFDALRRNPLVILLAQDDCLDVDVLRGIRERARDECSPEGGQVDGVDDYEYDDDDDYDDDDYDEDAYYDDDGNDNVLHVTPPPYRRATPEQYFARLGRQCGFTEEIRSAEDWEDVLYRRLRDGESLFVLVSSFDRGSEEGREQLGTILRSLSETYGTRLRVVFSGGERLAALKYEKGHVHSVLSSAERLDWPEPTVDDVLAWQLRAEYPALFLDRDDAAYVRTLCGAHPRWIRHCLWLLSRDTDEQTLAHYDAIDQVFIPYRGDAEARRRICRWLGQDDLGEWEAWIGDELLRRLYWKNVLREQDGRIVWRSEVACEVGRRVLGCGQD